jgi:hypothetical protein
MRQEALRVEVALPEGQRRLPSKLYVSCTDIDFAS